MQDELNVPDEEAVYNAVLRWVEHRPALRRDKMHSVLRVRNANQNFNIRIM